MASQQGLYAAWWLERQGESTTSVRLRLENRYPGLTDVEYGHYMREGLEQVRFGGMLGDPQVETPLGPIAQSLGCGGGSFSISGIVSYLTKGGDERYITIRGRAGPNETTLTAAADLLEKFWGLQSIYWPAGEEPKPNTAVLITGRIC